MIWYRIKASYDFESRAYRELVTFDDGRAFIVCSAKQRCILFDRRRPLAAWLLSSTIYFNGVWITRFDRMASGGHNEHCHGCQRRCFRSARTQYQAGLDLKLHCTFPLHRPTAYPVWFTQLILCGLRLLQGQWQASLRSMLVCSAVSFHSLIRSYHAKTHRLMSRLVPSAPSPPAAAALALAV